MHCKKSEGTSVCPLWDGAKEHSSPSRSAAVEWIISACIESGFAVEWCTDGTGVLPAHSYSSLGEMQAMLSLHLPCAGQVCSRWHTL